MAVRIPTYERHVQLDAAAQTMPRFTANTETGKALTSVGDAMMKLGAHWQQKQDQFDKLQAHQSEALMHEQIRQIITEETLKFDPSHDPPGTLHNRIMGRVGQVVEQYKNSVPQSQRKDAEVKGNGITAQTGVGAAQVESATTNKYAVTELDRRVGEIYKQVQAYPDSGHDAVKQVDQEIASLDKLGTITPAQKQRMRDGYMSGISNHAQTGFAQQGRVDDGKAFADKFAADREKEGPVQFQKQPVPGTRVMPGTPGAQAPVDPSKYETKLNPTEEKQFQAWKAKNAPNDSGQDYDLRGAFKAGVTPDPQSGHMPDTFKKPNHPTFSDQSQYAKDRPDLAGRWDGETYVPPVKAPIPGPGQGAPAGPQGQVVPASGDTKLNEKRIAEIDAKPEIKAAIEKVAAETGMDPKVLKVAASIESSGNPNAVKGEHEGLFQLTKAEMGMNGDNKNIRDPEANARAYVAILQRNAPQLEKELGRPPTDKELYLSHQQGVAGATTHLQNPDQPAFQSMLSTREGREKGIEWAKEAVKGNIPKDVLARLFGGDVTKVSSGDMLAIQGTRFSGGNVDEAVANARVAPRPGEQQTITADASGRVIDTDQNQQPRTIIGGNVNAGGPPQPPQNFSVAGLPIQAAYAPGQQFGRSATANAEPFKAIVLHNTGGDSLQSALETQKGDPSRGGKSFGYHFYIDKDGTVYQGAPLDARTNHVRPPGEATRTARPDISNNNAIGVAYVGSGKPTPEQVQSGHALVNGLQQINPAAPIPPENVVGHGEIQGGSRDKGEGMDIVNVVRSGAQAPVLVGDDGSGRPAAPASLSRWQMDAERQKNALDGAAMKGASVKAEFEKKLKLTLDSDVKGMAANGQGVTLTKDMQNYFHTDKLSFDFVSNRLGTGTALTWQEQREHAQKFYEGTNNMPLMSNEGIADRLASLKPQPGTATFPKDRALYTDASKVAQGIFKDRLKDPAAAADQFPDVKAARDAAYADPTNVDKAKALVDARVKAMNFIGVPTATQSPITVDEARTVGAPLRALTDPDPTHSMAGAQVAKNVLQIVGNDPELATKAMETVLKQKDISKDTRQAAAAALQVAKTELANSQENPLTAEQPKQTPAGKGEAPSYAELAGFGYHDTLTMGPPPFDTAAESGGGREGSFVPGTGYIPPDRIQTLLANQNNPEIKKFFNEAYGSGAAEHFIKMGSEMSSSGAANQPGAINAQPVTGDGTQGDQFSFPLPSPDPEQADPYAPASTDTQTEF